MGNVGGGGGGRGRGIKGRWSSSSVRIGGGQALDSQRYFDGRAGRISFPKSSHK